ALQIGTAEIQNNKDKNSLFGAFGIVNAMMRRRPTPDMYITEYQHFTKTNGINLESPSKDVKPP
ncbi:MAG: hypothetical protein K2L56_02065, partial [Prevotella sp.]|nr:hypothetical protein [Prevotella sp.]